MLLLSHYFSIPFAMYNICYVWSGVQPGLNLVVVVVVELSALSGNLYEHA